MYINILRGFTAYLKFCNFGDEINRHMKLNAWNETEGMKLKLPLDCSSVSRPHVGSYMLDVAPSSVIVGYTTYCARN